MKSTADQINAFVEDESAAYLFAIEGADTTSWVVLIVLGGAWIVGTLLVILG